MPFGSFIVCIVLVLVQVASWPFLFVLGVQYHRNAAVTALLLVPMVLWLLLPAGSIYGLHLALRRESAAFGAAPRVLGIITNALYLLVGIFIWLMVLSGVASA